MEPKFKLQSDGRPDSAAVAKRRSDRVAIQFPIEVVGSDFLDQTHTVLVSRHGGKIVLNRILSADEELSVLCKSTGKEAVARVVGHLGASSEGNYYGIAFLDPEVNIWDIEFPKLGETEMAAARVLLECAACHARKVTSLDGPEAEVLEVNHRLAMFCKQCSNSTLWLPVHVSAAPTELPAEPPAGEAKSSPASARLAAPAEKRKEARLRLCVAVCVRDEQLEEEVTQTENVSRGGFCFKSRKQYRVNSVLQAALPYAPHQANIFSPGRVAHAEAAEEEGVFSYGVSYLAVSHGWFSG